MEKLERVATALMALGEMAGVSVIWKTPSMWHIHSGYLPEALFHHCNPFCRAVHASPERFARCNPVELAELIAAAQTDAGPFVKNCHAGVVEIVVPVVALGRVDGFLLAGPFRRPGCSCPYPSAAAAYAALPEFSPDRFAGLQALMQVLAAGLAELHALHGAEDAADPRIGKAVAYMQRHFQEPLRAAAVAAHCALSESRFIHLFSQQANISFSRYLTCLRIEEAKRLLADPRRSKAEIALAAGFANQSHFSATFRKFTGLTPGHYQTELRRQTERRG